MRHPSSSVEQYPNVNPAHVGLLEATIEVAPSAHNAQPWQIRPLDDGETYELHYNQSDDLPRDPHDKDAYLTMGAFAEALSLQAPNHQLAVAVTPELTRDGQDLFMARVAIMHAAEQSERDPLSDWIGMRVTNRNKYDKKQPLPETLELELMELGNVLVDPEALDKIVVAASAEAWGDKRYIGDLQRWYHPDKDAEDGITPKAFNIGLSADLALRFAFKHGPFKSLFMRHVFAAADVSYFTSAARASVLTAPDMTPPSLFEAGRRLLRSWVTITSEGYSYQPFSIGIDEEEPAAQVAAVAQVENPVALYRIGKAKKPPRGLSPRKPLGKVLITG